MVYVFTIGNETVSLLTVAKNGKDGHMDKNLKKVPKVFLDFSSRKRSRGSRGAATTESRKRRGEREKPLVTLASNLTFMQTTGSGSDPRALIG